MINRFLSKKLSSFQIICMGFVGAILLGTLLLRLPPATRSGSPASWEAAAGGLPEEEPSLAAAAI